MAVGLAAPSAAVACLRGNDTLALERSRSPTALELITGKFLRHSPEFYRWRIADRLDRLESGPPDPRLLDDLAVAYDKTGQHDRAIATALRTDELFPGRYEAAANLGTFYIHAGRLEDGLPHIERALVINPDAHFGREKYQKLLVEYVLKRRAGGPPRLPLAEVSEGGWYKQAFAEYIRPAGQRRLMLTESQAAVRGVLGMMRFGSHDSPVLLEALGTLLLEPTTTDWRSEQVDAAHLAARAFLNASYGTSGETRDNYRRMAGRAIMGHQHLSLEQVEAAFQRELADARGWYADLRGRELGWVRDGKDPEAEFARLYDAEPQVTAAPGPEPIATWQPGTAVAVGGGLLLAAWVAVRVAAARRPVAAREGA